MRPSAIELEVAGPGSWRVCDRSVARNDSRHVIAVVIADADGYSVTWMRGARPQTQFASLEAVMSEVHALRHRHRSAGPTRPIPIPRLPPPSRR